MTKRILVVGSLLAVLVCSLLLVPQVVRAHSSSETNSPETAQQTTEKAHERAKKLQEEREQAAKERMEALEERKQRLSEEQKQRLEKQAEKFKKACENRHEAYKKRLANVNERLKKHAETLDTIADRTKLFVTKKNLTVENYDALLADVATQRELVRSLHQTLLEKAEAFDCGNTKDEAKAALADFKDAFKQQIDAFKAYKMAVKDLVAAVRTAAQEGAGDES